MASSYIVGTGAIDAITVCKRVAKKGWTSTIGPWENVDDTPQMVFSIYQEVINLIIKESLDCYISIKIPSLNYDFEKLAMLLEMSGERDVRVHFDACSPNSAEPTFNVIEKALINYKNIGCTLPGRWPRSISDAERIIDWEIPVRVVKGQWVDPKNPDIDPREGFLRVVDVLSGKAKHVAVATHDKKLGYKAIQKLRESKTPCQLEQLFGLPIRYSEIAQPFEVGVTVYVPFGHGYLPYAIDVIRDRPGILLSVARDLFRGERFKI